MRDLPKIDVKGLKAADVSTFALACVINVNPALLKTESDDGAQRELLGKQHKKAREVYETFRTPHFKVPNGVYKDGHIVLLDGMMTAAIAAALGIPEIPVFVVDLPDLADRARAFVSHSTDRTPATPGQIWRGEVTAGDEEALAIKRVCDAAGVELLPYAPAGSKFEPGQTIALGAIRRTLRSHGADATIEVLSVCRRSGLPINAELIRVIAELLYGIDYQGSIDADQITHVLTDLGPRAHQEARALATAKKIPTWRGLVAVIARSKKSRPRVSFNPETGKFEGAEVTVFPVSSEVAPLPRPSPTAKRIIDRRPVGPRSLGDPEEGRSALDERRRAQG